MKTDEARAVLVELESKAAATRAAIAEINGKRAELSFAAHTGQPAAQKALAKANTDRTAKVSELEEIEHAISEARRLCAIAEAQEDQEAARQRAEQALPIAERLAERGKKLDAAIREYQEHYTAIADDITALARLGVPTPSGALVAVNLRRSHDAALASFDRHARPVRSHERVTFESLVRSWSAPALNWISTKLKIKTAEAA
jgi:hypothetical protein